MGSQTKSGLREARKRYRRKRRLRLFRLLIVLFLMLIFLAGVAFAGFTVYQWGKGIYQQVNHEYEDYQKRQEEKKVNTEAKFGGYTNVLVLGIDDGVDRDGADRKNADTIMLLSLENDTGRVRVISVPAGTLVNAPGGGEVRLGTLFAGGGAPFMTREISTLLNISIHQFVVVDMNVLTDLLNILGGIDIYVENDMTYEDEEAGLSIHLQKGYQHMDGETAVKYLRYRSTDLGDVGRMHRQQRFVKALYERVLQAETIPKLPAIADILKHRMTTSAEIFDSAHLLKLIYHINTEPPETVVLPGSPVAGDDCAWILDKAGTTQCINDLFPEDKEEK